MRNRFETSNYLTEVVAENLRLIPVEEFLKNPPNFGFGHVFKEGFIDAEFEVTLTELETVTLDATHVVWFDNVAQAKEAYRKGDLDPHGPRF